MNRDLIILLKSIHKNSNDRRHHILKLDEIMDVFNQKKLKVEQMIDMEERLLKDKVNEHKHMYLIF